MNFVLKLINKKQEVKTDIFKGLAIKVNSFTQFTLLIKDKINKLETLSRDSV